MKPYSRRGIVCGAALRLVLAMASLAMSSAFAQPEQVQRVPLRVLFIGNSFVSANDMPIMIEQLATSANERRRFESETIAQPGATLEEHWERGTAVKAVQKGRWDFVVLQEQSEMSSKNPEAMGKFASLFDAEIRKAGARTVLFVTWVRPAPPVDKSDLKIDGVPDPKAAKPAAVKPPVEGSPAAPERTTEQTQDAVIAAYAQLADRLGATLAPVAQAMRNGLKEDATLSLYQRDGTTASSAGSYLSACVLYSVFYGRSPEGLLARVFMQQQQIPIVQRVAWEAVRGP